MRFRKRRDEARLARFTAKTTVAMALGLPTDADRLRDVRIRNAADGAPEVSIGDRPAPLVIAMTDRADWSVAAVLSGTARIGCDLELVEPRTPAFVADYFTEAEQSWVKAADAPDLASNLIWSAKESALKVLRTGLRRDTRSVEVSASFTSDPGWHPLTVRLREGGSFPGWWIRHGQFLLTMAAAVATTEPVSLEEPPLLSSAVPSHTWLTPEGD